MVWSHRSGFMRGMALQDLVELYRAEGIQFDQRSDEGVLAKHVPEQSLHILIEDDGDGIGGEVLGAHPGEHLGLAIMHERAQRAGGSLTIESDPEEGTRVELRIPLGETLER